MKLSIFGYLKPTASSKAKQVKKQTQLYEEKLVNKLLNTQRSDLCLLCALPDCKCCETGEKTTKKNPLMFCMCYCRCCKKWGCVKYCYVCKLSDCGCSALLKKKIRTRAMQKMFLKEKILPTINGGFLSKTAARLSNREDRRITFRQKKFIAQFEGARLAREVANTNAEAVTQQRVWSDSDSEEYVHKSFNYKDYE